MQNLLQPLSIFAAAAALLMAGIFAQAAFSKLNPANQGYYKTTIEGYGLRSGVLSAYLPRALGAFELLLVVLILMPASKSQGLMLAALILAAYLLAFIKQLWQGKRDIDCGCAGPGMAIKISPALIARNAGLIALCLLSARLAPAADTVIWWLALPLALFLGLVYLSAEQLIANQQTIQALRKQ